MPPRSARRRRASRAPPWGPACECYPGDVLFQRFWCAPLAQAAYLIGDGGEAVIVDPLRDADELDRKSTRLNSSYVKISYAVFCLKKKKKNQRQYTTL